MHKLGSVSKFAFQDNNSKPKLYSSNVMLSTMRGGAAPSTIKGGGARVVVPARPPSYAPFVYLCLLMPDPGEPSMSSRDIIKEARYLMGRAAPGGLAVRIYETLAKLNAKGHITRKKINIMPRRRTGRLANRMETYRKARPVAAEMISRETRSGDNHREGRYESFYMMNPGLPADFLARIKHDTAQFFGFSSWHDGLHRPGLPREKIFINIKSAYAHAHGLVVTTKEGATSPGYETDNSQQQNSNGYEGVPRAEQEAEQALMSHLVSIPRQASRADVRGLDRRTIKLLERYGTLSQNTMKGEQEGQEHSRAMPRGNITEFPGETRRP